MTITENKLGQDKTKQTDKKLLLETEVDTLLLLMFETESHYTGQASLKFMSLQPGSGGTWL